MKSVIYTEHIACPLCHFAGNQPLFHEKVLLEDDSYSLGINECSSCQLCYISPRLNVNGLTALYAGYMENTVSGIYNVDEEVSKREYQQFAKYLSKELPLGGTVLDVGCGVGLMLDTIAQNLQNIKAEGVEFSSFAAEQALHKGHQVYIGDLTQIEELKFKSYDAIIILYVLEHVPNPTVILEKCYDLLSENGKLLIAVPNYRYLKITRTGFISRVLYGKSSNIHPGEHLFNYTPPTLTQFLDKCGFSPYFYGQAKPLNAGNSVHRFAKSIFSGFFDLSFLLGYQLGGIHLVSAKK